jgi:transcriptional regulator with XRE-family HTH domain
MIRAMDDVRIGRRVRAVRQRLGWRQADVAVRARVSQDTVSRIERGLLGALQLRTVRYVLGALEVELGLDVRWRGGDLDRLADEGHAGIVDAVCVVLGRHDWVVLPEVSYAVYGERGSIDVLAWHPVAEVLLVVEVKTALTSLEETLRRHDAKARLAPGIARDRVGERPSAAVRLLVLPADSTSRRHVARHDPVLRAAYPVRGRDAAAWLRAPHRPTSPGGGTGGSPGPIAFGPSGVAGLLMFLSPTLPRRTGRGAVGRRRVARASSAPCTPPERS